MPPIHSKPSKVAHLIQFQEEVLRHELTRIKPLLNTLKIFKSVGRISYEASKCYIEFYERILLVVGSQKAKVLADHLFNNRYPKSQMHRWFVDYYAAVLKTL